MKTTFLYDQSLRTPRPKLCYNAWRYILDTQNFDNPELTAMHDLLKRCVKESSDIDYKALSLDWYKALPRKYGVEFDALSGKTDLRLTYSSTPLRVSNTYKNQQREALNRIKAWLDNPNRKQKFILYGWAGVGKTFLAKEVSTWVKALAMAYTGKAALQLAKRGLDASTIHAAIYQHSQDPETGKRDRTLKPHIEGYSLLIIDEAGMLNEEIDDDIASFGLPMLIMGDPDQIGVIEGKSVYDNSITPDYQMTEIVRQALDNPVIWLSREIREGRKLKLGNYGDSRVIDIYKMQGLDLNDMLMAHQGEDKVIVGLNRTRISFNNKFRRLLKHSSDLPNPGEVLICLRNERTRGLVNGQLWSVVANKGVEQHICTYTKNSYGEVYETVQYWRAGEPGPLGEPVTVTVVVLEIKNMDNGELLVVQVPVAYFQGTADRLHWKQKSGTSEFDYGYTLTGHKAQGSTFRDTFVMDESHSFGDMARRWLYSVTTRTSTKITLATST